VEGYGVEPVAFYEEAIRLLGIRMRPIGCITDEQPTSPLRSGRRYRTT
jgi:hypothetical protein